MRQSKLFGKTSKTEPSGATAKSHSLLVKGGFIAESVAGRYYFLPLGMRVKDKIIKIIEKEMNNAGAQKIIAPMLHPIELWEETNRTNSVGFELMKVKDRRDAEFALGGTAEEMIVDLVRKYNISYKDIPFNIYQFSEKFRDELRVRGGLLRAREFLMKDAYSFHQGEEDFKKEYKKMGETYKKIFKKMGLETIMVESDNGYIGGEYCHEFVIESDIGESKFLITDDGVYAAHEEVAKFKRDNKNLDEKELPMEVKNAFRGQTIDDGVELYRMPAWRQIKTLIYKTNNGFVLVSIRGDLDINEVKLGHILNCHNLEMANEEEIKKLGSHIGFVSPLKLKIKKIGDISLKTVKNFYTGADIYQKDTLNVNYGRDFKVDILADIAIAKEGYFSEDGKSILHEKKGIEVGNIFQLGEHYSSRMDAKFTDIDGKEKFYYMGCYGIGIGRTMATIVEKYYDEKGIIWPETVAPYNAHLVRIGNSEKINKKCEELYNELNKKGIEVLYDDRDISAGVKFADSDLIGIPFRVVISEKTVALDSVEVKNRNSKKVKMVKLKDIEKELKIFVSGIEIKFK
ncbi:MAG: proline--tRNA ligase [bacterium]